MGLYIVLGSMITAGRRSLHRELAASETSWVRLADIVRWYNNVAFLQIKLEISQHRTFSKPWENHRPVFSQLDHAAF